MNEQQIHTLATIASRYTQLNTAARNAKASLVDVRFKAFSEMLTAEEKQKLYDAEDILAKIVGQTSESDSIKYFKTTI